MSGASAIDVLVVGLGPAGARAAAAAASSGVAVIGIDRRHRPGHPVQCAEFVPAMLEQEVNDLALLTHQRIAAMATYVESEPADIEPEFPGRMIDRAAFDAALVATARNAGADCRFNTALESLAPDGTAILMDGTVLRPRVIVGADGPRSRVGSAIGAVNSRLVETRQITVPLLARHDATDIFLSADIEGGYGWLFPKGEFANLGIGVVPAARARLKPLLARRHERMVADGRVGTGILCHTGGAIPVGGMVGPTGRLGVAPVLLAGDAAGLANPVTGAGIASAVISGGLAGEAAASWLSGDPAAPEDYEAELGDLFGVALGRALKRRKELLARFEAGGRPGPAALRRAWIAFPEYWAA